MAGMSGKVEDARTWAMRLVEIDPMTPFYKGLPGAAAWMRGDYENARALYAADEAAILTNPILRLVYAQILVASSHRDEGDRMFAQLASDMPDNPFGQLAVVYRAALNGDADAVARGLTPALVAALENDPQYCWFMGQCRALVNDIDGASQCIEAAVARGFINHPMLARLDPFLENLRTHARYQALMDDVERQWHALEL